MMNSIPQAEENFFSGLMHKYLPYWPLFVGFLMVALTAGFLYLKLFATPVYEITASIMIKDEEKGVNSARLTQSIDVFTSNKTVDNEINVLQSRALYLKVVNALHLYAPLYEEGRFKDISAYETSPIVIELKHPEQAQITKEIYFDYDNTNSTVKIDGQTYPLNQWVATPYDTLRFSANPYKRYEPQGPLYFAIKHPNGVVDNLVGKIRIQASSKFSSVVNMNMKDAVPQRGENVLNHLIAAYNQLAVEERNKLASHTLAFVEERIQKVEEELEDLENELVRFKATHGGVNLSDQGRLYLENVRDNDRKSSEIATQLAVLDQVEAYVKSRNKTENFVPSTLGINDQALGNLLNKLHDSELQYQRLSTTTAENNPMLVAVANEIESLRPRILENIRNQRSNLLVSRSNIQSTNNAYNSALQTIPQKEKELMELTRQQMVKNNSYNFLLQKREETVMSYAPTVEDSKVIDMASSTSYPISPQSMYIYLMAIMGALGAGIAFIAGKEILSNKLMFRSEIIANTNTPIVAELLYVKPKDKIRFSSPTEASVIEQFRQLRATLGLYGRTFVKKKILVTSSIPGEGKSYVSTHLAHSLAASGKKVALLDFDLRNPNTTYQFGMQENRGLIEYLTEDLPLKEFLYNTEHTNLSMIPAGIAVGDHTELLLNGKLEYLFRYLEEAFDYLIIDTPPIDLVSDAYLLSEYCDITLLVMRHAYTPKSIVQQLRTEDKTKSLTNAAIVFNGVKPRGFTKGRYGYGYGYGYGSKYISNKAYEKRGAIQQV